MADESGERLSRMFDRLEAVGQRLSAESRAARPDDQPTGPDAKLTALYWWLDPLGGALVQNASELFAGGGCDECGIAYGERTEAPMVVRYQDASSRRCDAVGAGVPGAQWGPTYRLFSERLVDRLSDDERDRFVWRPVEATNTGKGALPLYEIVGSAAHLEFVALRGGHPDPFECEACGRLGPPRYSLVGDLPDWLNPSGEHVRRGQPDYYVAADALGDSPPALCTAGEWARGVRLLVADARRWPAAGQPGNKGVNRWRVGAVAPHLIDYAWQSSIRTG